MSPKEERRITCPSCGKMVPAMVYCIYCGARLPRLAQAERPEAPPRSPVTQPPVQAPPTPLPVPPVTQPAPPSVRISPPSPAPPTVKEEILAIMSEITKYYERKISLLDIFKSGEVTEKVFMKLYDEYANKLNELLNLKANKINGFKKDLEEKNRRLEEIKVTTEELDVRYKIGEVEPQRYNERMNMLKTETNRLQALVKELTMNLNQMEKPLAEKTPREILNLEAKAKTSYDTLGKLVEEGKLTKEGLEKVKPDLEETIKFLDSVIEDRKEKEKTLREQLETLQARYRLSEITIEEYEKKKRELQGEIDKIWA